MSTSSSGLLAIVLCSSLFACRGSSATDSRAGRGAAGFRAPIDGSAGDRPEVEHLPRTPTCGDTSTACGAYCDVVCNHCSGVDVGSACLEAQAGLTPCAVCASNLSTWAPACGVTETPPSCSEPGDGGGTPVLDAGPSSDAGNPILPDGGFSFIRQGTPVATGACSERFLPCQTSADCCADVPQCYWFDAGAFGACIAPGTFAVVDAGVAPAPPSDAGEIPGPIAVTFTPGGYELFSAVQTATEQGGVTFQLTAALAPDAGPGSGPGDIFALTIPTQQLGTTTCAANANLQIEYNPDGGEYEFIAIPVLGGSCTVDLISVPVGDAGSLSGTFSAHMVYVGVTANPVDVVGTFDIP